MEYIENIWNWWSEIEIWKGTKSLDAYKYLKLHFMHDIKSTSYLDLHATITIFDKIKQIYAM